MLVVYCVAGGRGGGRGGGGDAGAGCGDGESGGSKVEVMAHITEVAELVR